LPYLLLFNLFDRNVMPSLRCLDGITFLNAAD